MTEQTMRAVQQRTFGGPEVLKLVTVPVPSPGPNEVLVRVRGSSLNAADSGARSGGLKLMTGRKFPKGTGVDFAGEVAALGAGVTDLKVGDKVWGYLGGFPGATGTAAEYAIIKRAGVSRAPTSLDLAKASALPAVALTALQALRALSVKAGDRLLITGASGGVGSSAVQLGVALGARVTAVCSAANAGLVRSLGADQVIDYATADLAALPANFDVALDCHGSRLGQYRRLVARGGKFGSITMKGFAKIPVWLITPGPRLRPIAVKTNSADLQRLAEYVDAGKLKPVIDKEYTLEDIVAAHRALDSGHAAGKRVLRVTPG
ncbi:MAG TPA: NAD(P)-dependent alcohol dehydrogenase [Polyangia bacterium]|jgi:NADPH:quinone reductase-like Zn-dependent oxidoreductase